MSATRRLAAILAADVAGYSRLIGGDEGGTLERLKALRRELLDPKIAEHHGRIVKTTGDGLLLEFPSVVDAVRCAVDVQRGMAERCGEAFVISPTVRKSADRALCRLNGRHVLLAKVKSACHLAQAVHHQRPARVEPDACFERRQAFFWFPRVH